MWSDGRLARPAVRWPGGDARLSTSDTFYFSTRQKSPVDAFTATCSLAVSRSVP